MRVYFQVGDWRRVRPSKLSIALALVLLPANLPAQSDSAHTKSGSPAVRVMLQLRAEGVSGEALFVLRGFRGSWTRPEQDELADSLAAFVIAWTEGDGWKRLEAAYGALSLSTRAEGYGRPYPGAGSRLRRIAESGVPHSLGSAINTIVTLPDQSEAVQIVRELARFPGPAAEVAVQKLEVALGTAGLDALRQLYLEGSAGTARARSGVASAARRRGWVNDREPPARPPL